MRKFLCVWLLVLSFCAVPLAAEAVGPDLTRTGSISVTMKYQETPVPGGSLTLYRVAEIQQDQEDYTFRFVWDYVNCNISLEDVASAATAQELARYTAENSIDGTEREINAQGKVSFQNLKLGLYLLVQTEAAEGYSAVSPFLVTVPGRDGDGYIYDVNASPKLDLEQDPTDPTDPSDPTDPTDPSDPTDPTDPTGPTDPSDPTGPTDPSDPSDPTEPGGTTKPTEPGGTTKPTDPGGTTKPTEPGNKLPQTGQTRWPVPVLAVLGLIFFLLGWYLRRTGKNEL